MGEYWIVTGAGLLFIISLSYRRLIPVSVASMYFIFILVSQYLSYFSCFTSHLSKYIFITHRDNLLSVVLPQPTESKSYPHYIYLNRYLLFITLQLLYYNRSVLLCSNSVVLPQPTEITLLR